MLLSKLASSPKNPVPAAMSKMCIDSRLPGYASTKASAPYFGPLYLSGQRSYLVKLKNKLLINICIP